VVVGRKANCDLRIPLTSVSRQHCQITVDGEKIAVKDLGSSNGTYHNSVRVQEASLSAGDELVVGPVVFTLVVDGQPGQIKPVRTIVTNDQGVHETAGSRATSAGASASSVGSVVDSDEALDIPSNIEEEESTPTVDLDDPIAALEAMANSEDSDEFDDIDFFDDEDDVTH
jgi:pSer/pThr/pTyr-binding forkhead associated (FHA) protein